MNLSFSKYQGAGNDFIVIDNRSKRITLTQDQIQFLCDRHFGIGSDGLILIENGSQKKAEFDMIFYNPDGSQSLCGNGSRCAVHFAYTHAIVQGKSVFNAYDGLHHAAVMENEISISMGDVSEIEKISDDQYYLNTGSPHYISFEWPGDDVFFDKALSIRHDHRFAPGGVNVNFVKVIGSNSIEMRTFERGVENETLSCGTGVTAAAIAFAARNSIESFVNVKTKGGNLKVDFVRKGSQYFSNILLTGPAQFVFSGNIEL